MKRLVVLMLLCATPAWADGTINTLSPGGALTGPELIPMFQTANPASTTTPAALDTYLAATTKTLTNKTLTAPIMTAPVLGTIASGVATGLTGLPLTTGVTGLLPVANGGTGTATPSLVAGSNVTVTGTWPNQTVASTGGGGGTITVTAGGGTSTGVSTVAFGNGLTVPSGSSGTAAVTLTNTTNSQSGASYTLLTTDASKTVWMTNVAATTVTVLAAATAGAGYAVAVVCDAGCTIARSGSDTLNGAATSITLAGHQLAYIQGDGTSAYRVNIAAATPGTIASGTSALGTSAIASATCASVVTTAATGTATTDVVTASFNGDPTAVTGYIPLVAGMLTIVSYPTANNVNFKVCNNTSSSITPGAITLNWRVAR